MKLPLQSRIENALHLMPLWRSYYHLKLKRVIREHMHGVTIFLTLFLVCLALSFLALLGWMTSGLPTGYAVADSPESKDCFRGWNLGGRNFDIQMECQRQSLNISQESDR